MANYVKITDYAAKDALLTGDPAKLVKGTEIGADLDAVAIAVATKYDSDDARLADVAALTPTDNGVIIGDGSNFVVESGATLKTSLGLTIGTDIQAYDADTAKTDVAQTFTASQRGTITTDADGSFDQSVTNNFLCTPTGNVTLTFTNIAAGQSGFVLFDNSGAYTGHSLASTTKASASFLTTINASGVFLISYLSNGTNTYVVAAGPMV